eukprot:5704341-Lingulodinium_polyedra.AAC.1
MIYVGLHCGANFSRRRAALSSLLYAILHLPCTAQTWRTVTPRLPNLIYSTLAVPRSTLVHTSLA